MKSLGFPYTEKRIFDRWYFEDRSSSCYIDFLVIVLNMYSTCDIDVIIGSIIEWH